MHELNNTLPVAKQTYIRMVLESLPFVKWDRFTQDCGEFLFYGWIDREQDEYKDFVLLEFSEKNVCVNRFVTSSSKHSEEISDILFGKFPTGETIEGVPQYESDHQDCIRVEKVFKANNIIHLDET